MGCDTSALATPAPVVELAQWLRSLRRRAGLSYRQMARQATLQSGQPVPHLRFFHAARGDRLPAWPVVQEYVRVCGGDERHAERLWKKAEAATAPPGTRPRHRRPVLPPQYICEPVELLDAMRALRFAHGNKTLRQLEATATENGVSFLPRSSLGAVLSGQRRPSKTLLLAFVRVCGGIEPGTPEARLWEQAWERADAYQRGLPAPTAGQLRQKGQAPKPRGAEQETVPLMEPEPAVCPSRPAKPSRWRHWVGRRLLHQATLPYPRSVTQHGN
ncbi:helix-turn-helix domain-containing protein [Streptomyces sp. RM72]|uniref:helix-turn-helix domain-containing protein n=1 Tax=unclassified Streptomyces TaxID=2593676 RepID=UPI000EF58147|nr:MULTISPECIES: helix-turn-helix domain-containing protein [unclassified Streptomyces]MBQ0888767.1 helix-turn-helix domain-containing protein [Streptomyces sp. RM72]